MSEQWLKLLYSMMRGETIRMARLSKSEFGEYPNLTMKDHMDLNIPYSLADPASVLWGMTMNVAREIINTSKVSNTLIHLQPSTNCSPISGEILRLYGGTYE